MPDLKYNKAVRTAFHLLGVHWLFQRQGAFPKIAVVHFIWPGVYGIKWQDFAVAPLRGYDKVYYLYFVGTEEGSTCSPLNMLNLIYWGCIYIHICASAIIVTDELDFWKIACISHRWMVSL